MYDRDSAVSPWAFFLPVTLAVIVGSLIAGGIRHLASNAFGDVPDSAQAPAEAADTLAQAPQAADIAAVPQPAPEPQPAAVASALPATPPAAANPDAADLASVPAAIVSAAADDAGVVADAAEARDAEGNPMLPGPISARQSGASRSCINGTVASRSPNGWEQVLENDAPLRCTATTAQ